jgi:hypothetical protein
VARFLEKQGYLAFALVGGYLAWHRAGYPIVRKEATAALPAEALCPECGLPAESHVDDDA